MNIYLIIIFPIFYFVEWPYDQDVYQIAYIYEDQHYQLDNWVVKADHKNNCCDKFMEIVEEWLSYLPRTNFCLNWEVENKQLVYSWLSSVRQINLVFIMGEMMILILDKHSFLISYEIVSLSKHQIDNWMIHYCSPHLIQPECYWDQTQDHKQYATENRKSLNSLWIEETVQLHIKKSKHKNREEEKRYYSMQMFPPYCFL